MNKLLKRAFTLIELLVVIAIIGILSGLIIVSMSGVTQKANIAKAQVFSNSLRNSLMLNLVSEWKLDEIIGTAAPYAISDSWSGGNTGTLYDGASTACSFSGTLACPQKVTSGCVSGNCIYFDGVNDNIIIPNNSNMVFGTGDFTIGLWIKTPIVGSGNWAGILMKGMTTSAPANTWGISECAGYSKRLSYQQSTDAGGAFGAQITTGNLSDGWHYFVVTRTGTTVKVYVDGSYVNQDTTAGDNLSSTAVLRVGMDLTLLYAQTTLDEIRIYDATMPASQIKEQYFAGINSLLASNSITFEEYMGRIDSLAKF